MKSNRSAGKRFSITASGKIKRQRAGGSHYNTHKPKARKRRLRKATYVNQGWHDKVILMLKDF